MCIGDPVSTGNAISCMLSSVLIPSHLYTWILKVALHLPFEKREYSDILLMPECMHYKTVAEPTWLNDAYKLTLIAQRWYMAMAPPRT